MALPVIDISLSAHFDDWWGVAGESVEPANVRRNGESGVERFMSPAAGVLYIKRQRNHLFRSLRYPFGLPTVMREKFATQALNRLGIRTPELVFAESKQEADGWRAILVTKALEGFVDLESWHQQGGRQRLGEDQYRLLLQGIGQLLGVMHRHHWQHTCLYPKHIFLTAGDVGSLPDVALLDLEKARRRLLPGHAARRDLDQLRRHSVKIWSDSDWQVLLAAHRKLQRL
ncbi:MAG: InaA protein [Pseudomonadales bacterium]|nr:InaA protein [Pseudomonadales bacterium]